jgi:hypothetical protein
MVFSRNAAPLTQPSWRLVRESCERTMSPGLSTVMVPVEETINHASGRPPRPKQAAVCFGLAKTPLENKGRPLGRKIVDSATQGCVNARGARIA